MNIGGRPSSLAELELYVKSHEQRLSHLEQSLGVIPGSPKTAAVASLIRERETLPASVADEVLSLRRQLDEVRAERDRYRLLHDAARQSVPANRLPGGEVGWNLSVFLEGMAGAAQERAKAIMPLQGKAAQLYQRANQQSEQIQRLQPILKEFATEATYIEMRRYRLDEVEKQLREINLYLTTVKDQIGQAFSPLVSTPPLPKLPEPDWTVPQSVATTEDGALRAQLLEGVGRWEEAVNQTLDLYYSGVRRRRSNALEQLESALPGAVVERLQDLVVNLHALLFAKKVDNKASVQLAGWERTASQLVEQIGISIVIPLEHDEYAAEVHDLQAYEPSTDMSPRSVVRVTQPGYRKGNQIISKPKVYVSK